MASAQDTKQRKQWRSPLIAGILLLAALSVLLFYRDPERTVMRYYDRYIANPNGSACNDVIVNPWNGDGEHKIVEYLVTTRGSRYYGFFYSPDNVPVSFQNSGETLAAVSDSEWEWRGKGDNRGYIRQIEPYWFYFEARF